MKCIVLAGYLAGKIRKLLFRRAWFGGATRRRHPYLPDR
ncbi:hypothetical protein TA5114_00707 [Cognatishimia activa]|uniref:Uncharacterized protein n=1 Tax=Cognatishimia activa TaxID=1715691 RepID=A0A0P1IUU4_9RHOB|nr:hypothetical protein TA5113_02354 [Cognatishimia activa]CUK24918.1 hypothetical protein TA5114_00707 [Cognatishimia activa]